MKADQIIKQYERGILTEDEARTALQAAYDRGEITLAERDKAMEKLS